MIIGRIKNATLVNYLKLQLVVALFYIIKFNLMQGYNDRSLYGSGTTDPFATSIDPIVEDGAEVVRQKVDYASVAPGFGACLLVLDDTIRLYEWIAYHYTVLPLTHLVIGIDPNSANHSIAEIYEISKRWANHGLNITVWPNARNPLPKVYDFKVAGARQFTEHNKRQKLFVVSCTHHFMDHAKEKWLLHTDSDEFLSYNFIQPGENTSYFDHESSFWKSKAKRAVERSKALPIRRSLPHFENETILSFIEQQRANVSQSYFPSKSGCTRLVGLTYGINTTDDNADGLLMTKKYQMHSQHYASLFSKVFLELPKIRRHRRQLNEVQTIHNPFPQLCGRNGATTSGADFSASILKVSHYVGSLESWLERGEGKGSGVKKQDHHDWYAKNEKGSPYTDILDVRMGYWVDAFLSKVGKNAGQELLFSPLCNRTSFVRSRLGSSLGGMQDFKPMNCSR